MVVVWILFVSRVSRIVQLAWTQVDTSSWKVWAEQRHSVSVSEQPDEGRRVVRHCDYTKVSPRVLWKALLMLTAHAGRPKSCNCRPSSGCVVAASRDIVHASKSTRVLNSGFAIKFNSFPPVLSGYVLRQSRQSVSKEWLCCTGHASVFPVRLVTSWSTRSSTSPQAGAEELWNRSI